MKDTLILTPKTKIAEMLDTYPELEEILIEISPEFKKLKNPILRKTIAKVTSIEQAAAIGNVSLDIVINKMRTAVGQDKLLNIAESDDYSGSKPEWFNEEKITVRFDARPVIAAGEHPLGEVMKLSAKLTEGEIMEMITPFLPAPLIDQIKAKGLKVWTNQESDSLFRNYFAK